MGRERKLLAISIVMLITLFSISMYYYKFYNGVININYDSLSPIDKIINVLPIPLAIITSSNPSFKVNMNLGVLERDYKSLYDWGKNVVYPHYTTNIWFWVYYVKIKIDKSYYNSLPYYIDVASLGKFYKYTYKDGYAYYKPVNLYASRMFWSNFEDRTYTIYIRSIEPTPQQLCIDGKWEVCTPSKSYDRWSPETTYCSVEILPVVSGWSISTK